MFGINQRITKYLIPALLIQLLLLSTFAPSTSYAANVKGLLRGQALKWHGQVVDLGPLVKFYKSRRGKGIWTDKRGLNKHGKAALSLISRAHEDGLVAADYIKGFRKVLRGMIWLVRNYFCLRHFGNLDVIYQQGALRLLSVNLTLLSRVKKLTSKDG